MNLIRGLLFITSYQPILRKPDFDGKLSINISYTYDINLVLQSKLSETFFFVFNIIAINHDREKAKQLSTTFS